MIKGIVLGLFILVAWTNLFGQFPTGRWFGTWGYNRAQFTNSDIHIKGEGYSFVVNHAQAKDRPTQFKPGVYFNPGLMTIPQYNFRVGYFLNDKTSFSLGIDHMKYVMVQWQTADITGIIENGASVQYSGVYYNTPVLISDRFLMWEHTNGLNYFSGEIDRYMQFFSSKSGKIILNGLGGAGAGFLVPRSDVSVFGTRGANIFHLAGMGADVHAGIQLQLAKHLLLKFAAKSGFIYLPNVLTYRDHRYKAHQNFGFLEESFSVGYIFNAGKKQKYPGFLDK